MAEKNIKTRIILTHNDYNDDLKQKHLKEGEVVLAKVGEITENNVVHPVFMMKVGIADTTKTVADLPWLMAPAADVYGWAKKANLDVADIPELPADKLPELGITVVTEGEGNAVTAVTYDDKTKTFTVTKGEIFATKAENDDKADKVTNATAGNFAGLDENGNLTDSGKKAADFAEAGHIHDINASGDDAISVTGGELSVTIQHHETLDSTYTTVATETAQKPKFGEDATINVPKLEVNKYGHITKAEDQVVKISIPGLNEVAESSHTHTDGKGTKVTGDGAKAIDLNVEFKADLVTKNDKKYLQLVDATSKEVIAEFDTTEFIKDGMLESVTKSEADNTITFTWNTDSGISETVIDIDDLVEVYAAGKGISVDNFVISHQAKPTTGTAEVATAGSGRTYVTEVLVDDLGHIAGVKTATETDQDLTHDHDDQYVKIDDPIEIGSMENEEGAKLTSEGLEVNSSGSTANYTGYGFEVQSVGASFSIIAEDSAQPPVVSGSEDVKGSFNEWLGTKTRQEEVPSPAANGKALAFIDSISQNENGEITATKKNVNLDDYALKSEIPTDFGVTKITSNDTTTSDKDDNVSGLKITPAAGTGEVNIEIDDTIVFILDGGDASNLD